MLPWAHIDHTRILRPACVLVLVLVTALPLRAQEENNPFLPALETDAASPMPADTREEEEPPAIFGTEDKITGEIFGMPGGRIHPYLSIKAELTDNLYNINTDEQSSLLTVVSPGIWIGFPRMERIPVNLNPYNAAAGGARFSLPGGDSYERFQAYLLAGADYKSYSYESDLNHTAWRIEGLFQYNMPAGLSFRFMDRLTRDRDRYDRGSFLPEDFAERDDTVVLVSSPSRIRDYYSNQANLAAKYEVSDKYALLFDYYNFLLDYDEEENNWLDRMDNRYSLSLKYEYSPKTSLFLEYDFADIRYDTETANNSNNTFYYTGIKWRGTAKTTITAKGGYQVKKYDNIEIDDQDAFSMEMDLNYLVTDKTKISMNLYKALEETDSLTDRGKETVLAKIRYDQNFNLRIKGNVEFWYETSDYTGLDRETIPPVSVDSREDKRFLVRPAVQYIIRDWFMAEMAYTFENRNSTDNFYDFTTHTLVFSLNAAL
jgi:hypothetical protein